MGRPHGENARGKRNDKVVAKVGRKNRRNVVERKEGRKK